jgi:uncharacterized protein YqgC (DUF456 family)
MAGVGMICVLIGAYVGWRYIVVPFWRATVPEAIERRRTQRVMAHMEREAEARRRLGE